MFSARRATLEDVPVLQELWRQVGLPWEQLADFINEFQVVTDDAGNVVGAAGLLLEGDDGLLHSEAIVDGLDGDSVRLALWRRVQIVSRNQGVARLWTQEDAEYWRTAGFQPSTAAERTQAKVEFLGAEGVWLVFQVGTPDRAQALINEQLAILEATRMQDADDLQQKIRTLRLVAYLMAFLVIGGCLALLFYIGSQNPEIFRRLMGGR